MSVDELENRVKYEYKEAMKPIKKEPILPENKIHKCPYNCGLGFLVYNSLINHISNDHLENLGANETQNANYLENNPYKCFKCEKGNEQRQNQLQN